MSKKKINFVNPDSGKRINPHAADNISPEQQPPIFSFYKIRKSHCISNCTKDEKEALVNKIYRLSQLPWSEIRGSQKHGLGYEEIAENTIKAAIPQDIKGEVTFIAFRFHENAPMVGYRERRIFHIIWIDRDFTLYKH